MQVLENCIAVIWDSLRYAEECLQEDPMGSELAFSREDVLSIEGMQDFSETTISYALWYLEKSDKIETLQPKNPRNPRFYRVSWFDIPF